MNSGIEKRQNPQPNITVSPQPTTQPISSNETGTQPVLPNPTAPPVSPNTTAQLVAFDTHVREANIHKRQDNPSVIPTAPVSTLANPPSSSADVSLPSTAPVVASGSTFPPSSTGLPILCAVYPLSITVMATDHWCTQGQWYIQAAK
jgi:hypothetical protein